MLNPRTSLVACSDMPGKWSSRPQGNSAQVDYRNWNPRRVNFLYHYIRISPKRRRYCCGPLCPFQNFYIFAGSNNYNIASTEASIEYLGQRKVCKSARSCALESFSCSDEPWLLLATTQLHPCLSGPPYLLNKQTITYPSVPKSTT